MRVAKSTILKIALAVSLAVNVAVIAFVGSQWARHAEGKMLHGGFSFDRRAAIAAVDDSHKKNIKEIWRDYRPELRSSFRGYHKTRRELASLLSKEELAEKEITSQFYKMLSQRASIEQTLFAALLETAQYLPAEERQQFFKKGFKKWSKRKSDKAKKPEKNEQ